MGVDVIKELINNQYSLIGSISVITIFISKLIYKSQLLRDIISKMSDKWFDNFLKNKENKKTIKNISESDINNHDIYNHIDYWMYSKIPTFSFSTEYRTLVFRKYLTIYLKNYKKNLIEYTSSNNYKDMDSAKMWKTIMDMINKTIYDYEREMHESGIPAIIIEKMKSKNNDLLDLTIDLIEGICNSQFYESDNNYLKIYSILNIILSIMDNTISNSDSICNSINGALRGLEFQGKIEP